MKFLPRKQSERSALTNHTDWVDVTPETFRNSDRVLLACICHASNDRKGDLRWVFKTQIK